MKGSNELYAVFLLISALLSAFAGGVILRRWSSPGAPALFLFLLGSLIWSVTCAIHWIVDPLALVQSWFKLIYSIILSAVGLLFLLTPLRRFGQIDRRQAAPFLIGLSALFVSNIITYARLNPYPDLDLTPMAFSITGAVLTFGLLRYGLRDLIPIGRDVLMDKMDEGMLLLDDNNRIIDFNPAALWLLQLNPQVSIGAPIDQALAHSPELMNLLKEHTENKAELSVGSDTVSYIQIQITRVKEQSDRPGGTLLIVHDITNQKKTEADLLDANRHLETRIKKIEELQNDLREQTFRDPLTGLYNRRYLEETLPRDLAKSFRAGKPLSLIMIDIDHFRRLNDAYGHQAGDLALQRLSNILLHSTRSGDIVARFGGDEFVIVFSDTPAMAAVARVQEWRALYKGSDIIYEGQPFRVTFSAGVVTNLGNYLNADELIHKAEEALSQAKSSGRDGVHLSE